MIYQTKKWTVEHDWESTYRSFKDGPLRYVTNAASLNQDQLEKVLRIEGGFPTRFAGVSSAQGFAATTFGSSTLGTVLATGPEFAIYQNVMWLGLGGILATIAGAFGYHGYKNAKKALGEARARKAALPSEAKLFPIVGRPWDALKEALEQIEADDIAKTKAIQASKLVKQLPAKSRQVPARFKETKDKVGQKAKQLREEIGTLFMSEVEYEQYKIRNRMGGNVTELEPVEEYYPGTELVLWQILMTALKEHTPLGRQLDIIMSNYLVRTDDLVAQINRSDQDPKWVKQLEDTLRRSAYAQMMEMYPLLTAVRDSECFEPGQKCTEDEYKILRTRGEAAAAAEAAICAAEPLTYSYQTQLP